MNTRPKITSEDKPSVNIFSKKIPPKERSLSQSSSQSFDSLGNSRVSHREKDENNAHFKQEVFDKVRQIEEFKKKIKPESTFE